MAPAVGSSADGLHRLGRNAPHGAGLAALRCEGPPRATARAAGNYNGNEGDGRPRGLGFPFPRPRAPPDTLRGQMDALKAAIAQIKVGSSRGTGFLVSDEKRPSRTR